MVGPPSLDDMGPPCFLRVLFFCLCWFLCLDSLFVSLLCTFYAPCLFCLRCLSLSLSSIVSVAALCSPSFYVCCLISLVSHLLFVFPCHMYPCMFCSLCFSVSSVSLLVPFVLAGSSLSSLSCTCLVCLSLRSTLTCACLADLIRVFWVVWLLSLWLN